MGNCPATLCAGQGGTVVDLHHPYEGVRVQHLDEIADGDGEDIPPQHHPAVAVLDKQPLQKPEGSSPLVLSERRHSHDSLGSKLSDGLGSQGLGSQGLGSQSQGMKRRSSGGGGVMRRSSTFCRRWSIENLEAMLADKAGALTAVENLLKEYDVLKAEALLAALASRMERAEVEDLYASKLFANFRTELEVFYSIGKALCTQFEGDPLVYKDDNRRCALHMHGDPVQPNVFHYTAQAQLAGSLPDVMCVLDEMDLWPKFTSHFRKMPEVLGTRTAQRSILHYQNYFFCGMLKLDHLTQMKRFTDPDCGFVCEEVTCLRDGHPQYRPAKQGHERLMFEFRSVYSACGPNMTVFTQKGTLEFASDISVWQARKMIQHFVKSGFTGLAKGLKLAQAPGSPWQARKAKDAAGFYARVAECAEGPGSSMRALVISGEDYIGVPQVEIVPFFKRHHIFRMSPYSVKVEILDNMPQEGTGPNLRLMRTVSFKDGVDIRGIAERSKSSGDLTGMVTLMRAPQR